MNKTEKDERIEEIRNAIVNLGKRREQIKKLLYSGEAIKIAARGDFGRISEQRRKLIRKEEELRGQMCLLDLHIALEEKTEI